MVCVAKFFAAVVVIAPVSIRVVAEAEMLAAVTVVVAAAAAAEANPCQIVVVEAVVEAVVDEGKLLVVAAEANSDLIFDADGANFDRKHAAAVLELILT